MRPVRSLKGRALQWLAQREQSRVELRRKLLPPAMAEDAASAEAGSPLPEPAALRVEAVLDWLEAHEYLSHERFVESRVQARSARFGNLRIRHELKQHQVALSPEAALALKESEFHRAHAVRDRKFTTWPVSPTERAKQARFLVGRGFSPEVVGRVLRGPSDAEDGVG